MSEANTEDRYNGPGVHLPSDEPEGPPDPQKPPPPQPGDEPPPVPEGDPPSDAPPERAR